MKEITIDPEFRDLIPPLQADELDRLHKSLLAYGCRDKLVVWQGKDILLDGHNRYNYCIENNIEFEIEELDTSSRETAKNWIILNQLGRRNLSPEAASLLRGKLYNSAKKSIPNPGGKNQHKEVKAQNEPQPNTAETIAKETGVSPATVKRDATFAKAVEEQGVEAEVMAGTKKRKDVVKPKVKETQDVPRDWDFDTQLGKMSKYIYNKFADVPATDKADFREALINKIREMI